MAGLSVAGAAERSASAPVKVPTNAVSTWCMSAQSTVVKSPTQTWTYRSA